MLPETKRVLIVVRTYPTPARRGVEVSCTAAITEQREWLRLFPIPYRFLSEDQRFRKYQWITADVVKTTSDPRPESYKIKLDSIKIISEPLSTAHNWQARKDIVLPLRGHCLCCIEKERAANGYPTLGIFRPKAIEKLVITQETATWTQGQLEMLRQLRLFEDGPKTDLEKVPYSFKYKFRCDHQTCSGHTMICTDWEMGQSWRRWRDQYGAGWEAAFRHRYEKEMIDKNDTHFYVGTVHQHPHTWIIVGLFYPRHLKSDEGPGLFDDSQIETL